MDRDALYARIDAPRRRDGRRRRGRGGARRATAPAPPARRARRSASRSCSAGDVEAMKRRTPQLRQAPADVDAQARRRRADRRDRPLARRAGRPRCNDRGRDALREVAGARQRLPDRRGGRAPVRAHAGADPQALRPAPRRRLRRHPAALAEPTTRTSSRGCGSSTPTAPRPSCRATARARRSCTCAAAAAPTPTSSRSRPRPARSARGSPGRRRCDGRHGRARRPPRPTIPPAPPDGRGELDAGGRALALPARLGRQPAVRDRAATELEALDLPAIGPAIEHHELFPNRTNVSWYRELEPGVIRARIFERGVGETLSSGTGASGAAVAYHLAGGAAGDRRALDGGELDGRGRGGSARHPDRLGGARVRGHARRRLPQGAR